MDLNSNDVAALEAQLKADFDEKMAAIKLVKELLSKQGQATVSTNGSMGFTRVSKFDSTALTLIPAEEFKGTGYPDNESIINSVRRLIRVKGYGSLTAKDLLEIENKVRPDSPLTYFLISRTLNQMISRGSMPGLKVLQISTGGHKGTVYSWEASPR